MKQSTSFAQVATNLRNVLQGCSKTIRLMLVMFLTLTASTAWGAKITTYSSIVTGKTYYIGATTGGTDYYLSVNGASTSTSIAGTAVTTKANATAFVFTGSGTSWKIKFADYANYLGLKNSKDNGKVQVVSSAATFTASNQSGKLRLSIGSYSIQKNNSGTQFGSYGNTQTDIWLEEVSGSDEPATQYTINWHTAVGTVEDEVLEEGAPITKPEPDPTMSGYVFMGWTEDCEVASDGAGFTAISNFGTATEDKDYYAVFAKPTPTGGGGGSTTGSKTLVSSSSSSYYQSGFITGVAGTNSASWTADAFTMVQNKNSSKDAVALNYAEIRVYASHSIVFTPSTGSTITSIVATATSSSYATALGGSSIANCTKSVSNSIVTITPTDGTKAVTLTNTAQSRLKTIVVNYTTSGGGGTTTYDNYITTCTAGDPCASLQAPNVTATATANSITLSWAAVDGATSYNIYNYTTEDLDETTNLTYTFNGLDSETEYEWGVESAKGECFKETQGTTTTLKACTDAVTISKGAQNNGSFKLDKVGAQSTCSGAVVITLSEITPASGYKFSEITQTGVDANKVTINNNNKTITYTKNATGNSEINVNFIALQKLENPNNLSYSNLSCSGVTLAWNKVDGATNYQLIRTNKSTSASTTTTVNQQDNPSVYCTLSAGSSWSWSVQAIGDGTSYLNSDLTIGDDFTLPYTITYNTNGGTFIAQDCGTTLPSELPTTTKSHYTFIGWYMDEEFNTPATAGAKLTQNTTLYAKWEEIKFTITWSINETTNSQELQEGTTITPPADLEAATYACEDKVFVGWVDASIDGNTNDEPDFITDFGNVEEDKTYYAVFATPSGDGFTLGQSGDFTIYANVNGTNYYATGDIGDNSKNGKISSTTTESDANRYTFTAISASNEAFTYTIKKGTTYIAYSKNAQNNSTDFKDQDESYTWTISKGTKGSWRVASATVGRAFVFRAGSGYNLFGGYATQNITDNQAIYYDIEIGGATTYTEYVTSCVTCENVLTISKGNEENGKLTLDKVGEQETCDGLSVLVTPTPAEHYHVVSVTASTGETAVNNGDGTYTITYAANSTGESTINVVFEEDTKYTVTWMVNGLPYTIGAPSTTVYADERVATLPTPPEPNAYCGDVFVGWTTENPASGNFNEAPTVYNEQSAFPPATGNQTFYAVFADDKN